VSEEGVALRAAQTTLPVSDLAFPPRFISRAFASMSLFTYLGEPCSKHDELDNPGTRRLKGGTNETHLTENLHGRRHCRGGRVRLLLLYVLAMAIGWC
jgi:hypothetical protein